MNTIFSRCHCLLEALITPFLGYCGSPCFHLLSFHRRRHLSRQLHVTSGLASDFLKDKQQTSQHAHNPSKTFTISSGFLITFFGGFSTFFPPEPNSSIFISRTHHSPPYLCAFVQAVLFAKNIRTPVYQVKSYLLFKIYYIRTKNLASQKVSWAGSPQQDPPPHSGPARLWAKSPPALLFKIPATALWKRYYYYVHIIGGEIGTKRAFLAHFLDNGLDVASGHALVAVSEQREEEKRNRNGPWEGGAHRDIRPVSSSRG